jgi:hypothetical protein
MALVVCPSCARHINLHESVCPFCAAAVPSGLVPAARGPRRPYVGKVPTALALASALAAAGCGSEDAQSPSDVGAADTKSAPDTAVADTTAVIDTAVIDTAASDVIDSDVQDTGACCPIYK